MEGVYARGPCEECGAIPEPFWAGNVPPLCSLCESVGEAQAASDKQQCPPLCLPLAPVLEVVVARTLSPPSPSFSPERGDSDSTGVCHGVCHFVTVLAEPSLFQLVTIWLRL